MGMGSHGHQREIEDAADLGPSFLVGGREDQGRRVHLVVGEASQDGLRDMCEERHLVGSGRDGCKEPMND